MQSHIFYGRFEQILGRHGFQDSNGDLFQNAFHRSCSDEFHHHNPDTQNDGKQSYENKDRRQKNDSITQVIKQQENNGLSK